MIRTQRTSTMYVEGSSMEPQTPRKNTGNFNAYFAPTPHETAAAAVTTTHQLMLEIDALRKQLFHVRCAVGLLAAVVAVSLFAKNVKN